MTKLPAGYTLTDDQSQIDTLAAHAYLTTSYWAKGIPLDVVQRSLENSFCVAITHEGAQIGMARLVTDLATFAYLADVYVLENHRGRGLASVMIEHLQDHADLQGLRRWMLGTLDAHALYLQHGWSQPAYPERLMERVLRESYV